ncbi:MAG: replicative DNA helicase, partial [Spirochaetales bacterium]|nr:replicative DNA helicase [Spirochaetales bacterium]
SVLINRKAFEEVQTMLVKEDFYQLAHKQIWEGITGLSNERPGVALDYVSLSQYMSQKGTLAAAGGAAYIADLTNRVPTSTNAVYYAEIIRTASMKRQLFDLSIRIGDKAFDESSDIQESIDELDSTLSYLGTGSSTGQYEDAERLIGVVVDNVHDIMAGKKAVGVSSGFKILDKYIGGFKPSDLVIIAARPSVGKTALALSIAVNMAFGRKPVPVGFFSLEMSGATLIERIIANKGQINLMSLRNGKIDPETNTRMMTTAENLYENASNLLIQDTPNMKLLEICSQARRMVRDNKVQAIFIDYIGLVEYSNNTKELPRHEQVSRISRALKQLARELEVPIICLCQVNREGGKDRGPILADLRDSGSIEQDADLVILLDDPSKRLDESGKTNYEEDNQESEDFSSVKARPLKVIIAKQRNGSTGAFNLNFVSDYACFREVEKF